MPASEIEEQVAPDWPTCTAMGCTGIRLQGQDRCLAHGDQSARQAFLTALKPGADLDLRGTLIAADVMAAVFEAVKQDGTARFGEARFERATFSGGAKFEEAEFRGNAWFGGAVVNGVAWFNKTQFSKYAGFEGAQFSGDAGFDGAEFNEDAEFDRAQFSGTASFKKAEFRKYAGFGEAEFDGDAGFNGAVFSGIAGFEGAQFRAARGLGPLIVKGELSLDQAAFWAPILIQVTASRLSLVGAGFQEAATLRVRFADITLDGAAFSKPSTISFAESPFQMLRGGELEDHALEAGDRPRQPRLLSVRLADVSNLVQGGLDLSACLFQGAHNLEKLRIEGPLEFDLTPAAPWQLVVGCWRLPIWRWTRRQTLAEEHHRRAKESSSPGGESGARLRRPSWNQPSMEKVDWVKDSTGQPVRTLKPENLAALYRGLRKGLEDQKNAPGAADFYYGEMEMRRQSPTAPWSDRFVLWVYWLFSGYGLRASRALVAFAVLVPLFAIGFWRWGLNQQLGYPSALLRSFESATSLLRPASQDLNEVGQLLDILLRLIGATLLGLAVFSLRGRIKR